MRRDVRGRHRTSDQLLLDGRHHGGAVFRRDAVRPEGSEESRERSLRAVERARGADSLCRVGRGRRVRSRRAAEAARSIDSDLEGHPTPRLPFVDVATGSLGQGICAAIGIALNARRIGSDYRTYVLLGDGESAEGSVWEAANVGAIDQLDNLCGITDVNGLGQSRADDVGSRHGAVRAPLDGVRLARHRHRRPRHERDSRRARRSARAPRASRR